MTEKQQLEQCIKSMNATINNQSTSNNNELKNNH